MKNIESLTSYQGEALVLSAMMTEPELIDEILAFTDIECFYHKNNRAIYMQIQEMHDFGQAFDLYLLYTALETDTSDKQMIREHVSGVYDLLLSCVHYKRYLKKLIDLKIMRLEYVRSTGFLEGAENQNPEDLISNTEMELEKYQEMLSNLSPNIGKSSMMNVVVDMMKDEFKDENGGYALNYLKTGDPQLDDVGVFGKGAVTVIAGRPAMGKSSACLSLIIMLLKQGYKVEFFFNESSSEKMMLKLLCQTNNKKEADIALNLKEYAIPKTSCEATDILNIWTDSEQLICHEDVTTLKDLKAKYYKSKAKGFVPDIIFVDQITRFSDDSKQHGNRNLELEFINNSLEKLIKKEDVAICEVVQINREIEREAYPMPSMANLKDSGSFEQNASVVITFFRPKYYADQPKWSNKKEFISRMEENSIQYGCPDDGAGLILFNFVKNRYGEPGIIPMKFNLPGTRITSWKKNAMNYKMGFDEV